MKWTCASHTTSWHLVIWPVDGVARTFQVCIYTAICSHKPGPSRWYTVYYILQDYFHWHLLAHAGIRKPQHSLKSHINRFRGHASIVSLIIKHTSRSDVPWVCSTNYKIRFHVAFCNHGHVWKTIDSFQDLNSWWCKVKLGKQTYFGKT